MAPRVRVALRIPGTAPMPDVLGLIERAEAAGFDGAGILDSQLLSRDAFVALGLAATRTSRIGLFPAVTNPVTRHASVLASAIATVAELAPGRVSCVIGTGFTSATTIGRRAATLAEMRASIATIRTLLAGEAADFGRRRTRLRFAPGGGVPVLMAASGPRAIELAGEVADGAMLLVGTAPGIVAAALEHLERGARRGGRRLQDLEVVWATRVATAATRQEARRLARPTVVHWGVVHPLGDWLGHAGLGLPAYEIPQAVRDIAPSLAHAADWEQAIEATSFVDDEVVARLCDAYGVIGTAEDVVTRLAELAGAGVASHYVMPVQTFAGPEPELRAFADVVLPRLRDAGLR